MKGNTRRDFLGAALGIPCMLSNAAPSGEISGQKISSTSLALDGCICDVQGIKVGHYTDARRPTGCTVILTESGATAGVDVRGSAPGTRETALLNPINTVEKIHAIVLAGGSAFGLEAASGVMQYLEEKGIGYETRVAKIPIVPAAILFDLEIGDSRIRPDKQAGYQACRNAATSSCEEGNIGAGAGATVGKLFGFDRAMKSGVGTASIRVGEVIIGAIVAVNAAGDVIDSHSGKILAGARAADGKTLLNTMEQIRLGKLGQLKLSIKNTTIGVVATNVPLSKPQITKVAQMAQDGLARSINPVHTSVDGDTLFALSATGSQQPTRSSGFQTDLTQIGALAADVVATAVCRAITAAKGLPDLPSYHDLLSLNRG